MIKRKLGKTNWDVSAIGFGAWGVGGQWGDVEKQTAIDTIRAAYDAGVNFFDVADAYGEPQGLSEELIGQALRDVRAKVLIASKVGNWGRRINHPLPYTHPLHVELCCDASLHRMRLETIDVYQCHIGDIQDPSVFLQAFDTLIKKGKIRAWGVSANRLEVVQKFDVDKKCSVVQLDYSYLNRSAETNLLPYCAQQNIGVIVRGPLAQGICAGKFTPNTTFTDSVRIKWNSGPDREKLLAKLATVEKLRFLESPTCSMAQAALKFVISHPAVSTAIPGAKSPAQARANSAAGAHVFGPEILEQIRSLTN